MVRKQKETKAEKLNRKIHEVMQEIIDDKEHYREADAMVSKLTYISEQIMERVHNKLKADENKN